MVKRGGTRHDARVSSDARRQAHARTEGTNERLEAERLLWLRLVSRFLEHGDTMAEAMSAARRVVSFTRGDRTRRSDGDEDLTPPPSESETLPPPSSRFVPEPERRKR